MPGQAFVDVSVVGGQQIKHATVLAHDAREKELCFLTERLPQVVVEVREQPQIRCRRIQIAQLEPLLGEVGYQLVRSWIGQHPSRLCVQHLRTVELLPFGQIEQLVIGDAAP